MENTANVSINILQTVHTLNRLSVNIQCSKQIMRIVSGIENIKKGQTGKAQYIVVFVITPDNYVSEH